MAFRPSGVMPSIPGSRLKKRNTSSFSTSASASGMPVTVQATVVEMREAKSPMTSIRPRSRASSSSFTASSRTIGSRAPTRPGRKKGRNFARSAVCSGGSIRFSIGVTGWTLVSRWAEVVPLAAE
jgi:hypothetical protein